MRTDSQGAVLNAPPAEPAQAAWFQRVDFADLLSSSLFFFAVALQVFVAWKFRALTWDDSAITLGFSRTFAMTGRIEPTPGSGIVEGYSTTLWMLLMAAVARVAHSPQALLAVAKLGSLALNITSLFLLRAWVAAWMPRMLAAMIAGIYGCSFIHYESINGMETPLLLTLILAMVLLRRLETQAARWLYLGAGIAVLLTRWEAVWLLIPFVLLDRSLKRSMASASLWASMFAAATLFRRFYFGDWLPNTILAKHGPPYITGTIAEQVGQHLGQMRQIAGFPKYFAAIVVLYALYRGVIQKQWPRQRQWLRDPKPWEFYFSAVFLGFSVALTVAIGSNWGPQLRSFYTGWPFLFALILFPLAQDAAPGRPRRLLLLALGFMTVLTLVRVEHILQELHSPNAPMYMADATVAHVKQMNDILEAVQQASGKHNLLFAGPDMGAILLYSHGIRVIDLGLLCNRILAHERFGAVEQYVLRQQKPDVIEVHGIWVQLTMLDRSARFHDDYRPVVVNGRRVFLRRQLLDAIAPARLRLRTFTAGADDAMFPTAQGISPADQAVSSSFGTYLELH